MSCGQSETIDVEDFLTDREAPEHASFRVHFPDCADCAAAVARWSALDVALREPPPEAGLHDASHPDPDLLERFASSPSALGDQAMTIQAHVDRCPMCRTEVTLLERFEPAALAAAAGVASASVLGGEEAAAGGLLDEIRQRLKGWIEELELQRPLVLAFAAAAIAFLVVWQGGLLDGGAVTGESAEAPPLAAQQPPPPPPAPGPEELRPGFGGLPVDEAPESVPRFEAERLVDGRDTTVTPDAGPETIRPEPGVGESSPAPRQLAQAEGGLEEPVTPSAAGAARVEGASESAASEGVAEEMLLAALTELPLPSYAAPAESGSVGWMRQFGAVRGAGDDVTVETRAPNHVGLTLSSAPRLWWQVSGATEHAVEVTVVDDEAIDPILRQEIAGPQQAGLHSIDLAAYGVELSPGVEYRWFVSLVVDRDRPSRNPVSAGAIEVIPAGDSRREAVEQTAAAERGHTLAKLGLWYDAYDFFAGLSRAHPELAPLAQHRERMMELARVGR
jgi:hypothetical protein